MSTARLLALVPALCVSFQPDPPPTAEAPDGTVLPILSSSQHTLVVDEIRIGEGAEVTRKSTITVHYHGTFPDGRVFDTTRGKEPATFALERLIPGWQAGLLGMRPGGIRRLVIPPILAYGDKDRLAEDGSVRIPAHSTLVFSVHLLGVEPTPGAESKGNPVTTPSGLTIEDLVVGTGPVCPAGATVRVHYRGTLLDGKVFDSSYERGQPVEFPLPNLIRGWQEGIPGMRVGGKRRLTVPYTLGYGERGMPPDIPPRAVLVFEIELLAFR